MTSPTEDRLRRALAARADLVTPADLRDAAPPHPADARSGRRRLLPAAGLVAAATVLAVVIVRPGDDGGSAATDPNRDGNHTDDTGPGADFGTDLSVTDAEGTEHALDVATARCLPAGAATMDPRPGQRLLEVEARTADGSVGFTFRTLIEATGTARQLRFPAASDTSRVTATVDGRAADASGPGATGVIDLLSAGCSPAGAAAVVDLRLPGTAGPQDDLSVTGTIDTDGAELTTEYDGSYDPVPDSLVDVTVRDRDRTERPAQVFAACTDSFLDPGTRLLNIVLEGDGGRDVVTVSLPVPEGQPLPWVVELPWTPASEEAAIQADLDAGATGDQPRSRGSMAVREAGCAIGDQVVVEFDGVVLGSERGPASDVRVDGVVATGVIRFAETPAG